MQDEMQEIHGRLREFYPDRARRQNVLYEFAHRFLPAYVHQRPRAFLSYLYGSEHIAERIDPRRFIWSRWSVIFEPLAGLVPQQDSMTGGMILRCVTDLTMDLRTIGGRPAALVTMPAAERPPLAHFVCVVFMTEIAQAPRWPEDVQARIFTLEMFEEPEKGKPLPPGVLCEWTREPQHRNFGLRVAVDSEQFLVAVAGLLP